ncbi:MAG: ABC transporter permease [Sandaracinaceae bacterium]
MARLTAPLEGAEDNSLLAVRQAGRGFVLSSRLPESYQLQLNETEGVQSTAGVLEEIVVQDRVHVWVRGIVPDEYAALYGLSTRPSESWSIFESEPQTALAGHRVMEALGWTLGAQVTLPSFGMQLRIVGELPEQTPDVADHVLVHRRRLQGAREARGEVSYFLVQPEHSTQAATLARRIDARFAVAPVATQTESSQAFAAALVDDFSGFVSYLRAMSWFALLVFMLAVANAIAMTVRDRERELATLKALGFSTQSVVELVLAEAALLTGAGGAAGALIATALLSTVASNVLIFRWTDFLVALALAVLLGLLGGVIPAARVARMPPALALKGSD